MMSYMEVMNAIKEMVANGQFNYITYLNLVEQNYFTLAQYLFCEAAVLSGVIYGTVALIKYVKMVIKSMKEEIEG